MCQAAKRELGWQCVEHAFASPAIQLVRNMASHHQHSSAVDLPDELVEQAAAYSGAEDENRTADRIAEQE